MADMNMEPKSQSQKSETTTTSREPHDKTVQFTKTAVNATERAVVTSFDKTKDFVQHVDPRKGVRLVERLLDWDRKIFPPQVLERVIDWFAKAGFLGLFAAQILSALFFVLSAIKIQGQFWSCLAYGIGAVVILGILQFTADRFLSADRSMIEHSPSRMGSGAFLECVAVLAELGGIAAFIYFIIQAKQLSEWSLIWSGLGTLVLCDALAHIALNPSMVNLSIAGDVRAGDEALGILSFFAKAIVRLTPIAFGIGVLVGVVFLAWASVVLIRDGDSDTGYNALRQLCLCACLPLASYVFFAFYHLTLDLLWAVLAVPRKLDEMKENRKN